MAIRYLPKQLLRKMAPDNLVKKLVTQKLTLNKTAVTLLTRSSLLSKSSLIDTAIKVIRGYKKRYKQEREDGLPAAVAKAETLNDKALMVQRVKSQVIFEVANGIRKSYHGERYIWLPSSATEPDPLHQLKYGKRFRVGKGEMPGDRYGCMCGMQILVDEDKLEI